MAQPASATNPGGEGSVAFVRTTFSPFEWNIWTIGLNGTQQQLTSDGRSEQPSWSPNGEWIAYVSTRPDFWTDIFAMKADGSAKRNLTNDVGHNNSPTWAPDSRYVAYSTGNQIVELNLSTGMKTPVVSCNCNVLDPEYSPDGRYIAFSRPVSDPATGNAVTARLMLFDRATSLERVWVEMPTQNTQDFDISWHPNSSAAVWQWRLPDNSTGHLRAFVDGSAPVVYPTLYAFDWAMSPEGTRMVVHNRLGNQNIKFADLAGNLQGDLTPGESSVIHDDPSWQSLGTPNTDAAPPIVTTTSPTAGNVTQGDTVLADYACEDAIAGTGLASCVGTVADGDPVDTATLGAKTFSVTATDNAGNTTTKNVTYTVVAPPDTAKPTITITSPSGSDVVQGSTVLADYACADNVGVTSCVGTVPDGSAIDTATLGSKTFSVNAADAAGNTESKSVSYTVVAAPPSDTTHPTITVTSPTSSVLIGSNVTAQYTCADNVAVASCVGTVVNGAALDTATVGEKSFTITATDTTGLQTVKTVTYNVIWPFSFTGGPVDGPPTLNSAKAGGVIPVKFSLGGDRGMAILKAGSPASAKMACSAGGAVDALEEYASTPGSNTLSYDSTSGLYGYNWKTEKSWAGTCRQFTVKTVDGSTAFVNFQFK
jgi:Tol biopolymer transport system component